MPRNRNITSGVLLHEPLEALLPQLPVEVPLTALIDLHAATREQIHRRLQHCAPYEAVNLLTQRAKPSAILGVDFD